MVETEDDSYLGTAELTPAGVVVRNGFRGHPVTVPVEDVISIVTASECDSVA